jgi:hypothetical protein
MSVQDSNCISDLVFTHMRLQMYCANRRVSALTAAGLRMASSRGESDLMLASDKDIRLCPDCSLSYLEAGMKKVDSDPCFRLGRGVLTYDVPEATNRHRP